jgi:hypothetical protein
MKAIDAFDDDDSLVTRKGEVDRSNEERLRWNEANAPATIAAVRARITRFVRKDRRMR